MWNAGQCGDLLVATNGETQVAGAAAQT
eukprot:SAG22_NODE_20077_length_269_cov_0.564706_1_plen_27_part_01